VAAGGGDASIGGVRAGTRGWAGRPGRLRGVLALLAQLFFQKCLCSATKGRQPDAPVPFCELNPSLRLPTGR
jgi:hypothetical protein